MSHQPAKAVVMIRPAAFGFDTQTASTNSFQQTHEATPQSIQEMALAEFDHAITLLRKKQIEVMVYEDLPFPHKPSAVFPNNWFCTLPDGTIAVFPMQTPGRAEEKRNDILEDLSVKYTVSNIEDWSEYEAESRYLEGTGSMVIDYDHKIIYACISPRTNADVLEKFASAHGYRAIVFNAKDRNGIPVYHTNVLLCIADAYAVLCEDVFTDETELIAVKQLLIGTGHEIIPISYNQMLGFAGNMLQVQNKKGKKYLILSEQAFKSLRTEQKKKLQSYNPLIKIPVYTIEAVGGGSIRCMMANIHLTETL